jgi:hypothetical protein
MALALRRWRGTILGTWSVAPAGVTTRLGRHSLTGTPAWYGLSSGDTGWAAAMQTMSSRRRGCDLSNI